MTFLLIEEQEGKLHIGFYLTRKSPEQSSWQCDSARVVNFDDCVVVVAESEIPGKTFKKLRALTADTVTDRTDGSKVTVYDAEVRE